MLDTSPGLKTMSVVEFESELEMQRKSAHENVAKVYEDEKEMQQGTGIGTVEMELCPGGWVRNEVEMGLKKNTKKLRSKGLLWYNFRPHFSATHLGLRGGDLFDVLAAEGGFFDRPEQVRTIMAQLISAILSP